MSRGPRLAASCYSFIVATQNSRFGANIFTSMNDVNILGHVFGGSIHAMVDLTASATAQN